MNSPMFSPNGDRIPHGAMPVGIRPGPGVAPGPQPLPGGGMPHIQAPNPAMAQHQAQISAPTLPKGAQPVRLRGMNSPMAAPPQAPMTQAPAMPRFQGPTPQAALAGPAPRMESGSEIRTLVIEIAGADGRRYDSAIEIEMPPGGGRFLGVREVEA